MDNDSIALPVPPSVQAWISRIWTSSSDHGSVPIREHVLPTGHMHLVVRLSGPPLRLFAHTDDLQPTTIVGPVIGGARSRYYAKELVGNVVTMGAVLRPGASLALFGVSAEELAEQHSSLRELWGPAAETLHDQLAGTSNPFARISLLADCLSQRASGARPVQDLVQHAVAALSRPGRIDALVRCSALSHRSFIDKFRQATGLAPKQFARMMRFRQVLVAMGGDPAPALADVALECGFSDQAHLAREFRTIAGITASQYRDLAPANASHVQLGKAR